MSEADAGNYSGAIAPAVMIPQMVLEKIGFGIWSREIPGVSSAISAVGDRITNRAARLLTTGAIITTAEATIEVGQDFTQSVVEEIASAIQPELPDVDLMQEFKGAWAQFPEIAGQMMFLSLIGAAGGMNAEARARAFAEAPTRQLLAAGYTRASIEAIEAAKAKGQSSLNAAVDAAQATRDASSPEAAAAAAEEAAAVKAEQAAAQASGVLPTIVQTADGKYSVIDTESGEVIGTADDPRQAMRLAAVHSAGVDQMADEVTDYIVNQMESGAEALALAGDANARNSFELGKHYTAAVAAAENPESIDQFQQQAADRERVNGGTGEVAMSALGRNVSEIRNLVRTFTNRLFQGSSVRTIIHETGHGMLRRAWESGSLTREETLQIVRTINRAMGERRMKQGVFKGEKAALMDEAAYAAGTAADQDRMLHEAIAEFLEAEIMRKRKQSAEKSGMINAATVNRNIKATTRYALSLMPKALRTKFETILNAVRGVVGMSAMRAVLMKKAIREGTLKEADIESFLDKLTGRDLQAEHDGMVQEEAAEIAGQEEFEADEDNPFSLSRQVMPGDYPATAHKVIATTNVGTLTKIFLQPGEKLVPLDESKEKPMMVSPAYKAAKRGGDKRMAWEIAKHFTSGKRIEEYKKALAGKKPVFVAVRQRESENMNMLPIAAAWAIQKGTGLGRVAGDVWQIKQGGNTGATANERGNKEHDFEGVLKLQPGETVVLVDDTFTSGSTLTALFDYLHGQGVTAEHLFTLASGRYTKDVAATPEKQKAALDKIGLDAAAFERATGTSINAFTGAELHGYTLNGKPGISGFLARFDQKGISGGGRLLRGPDAGLSGDSLFSIAPSAFVDSLSLNVANRIKNPKARMAMFTRMLGKLGDLKRDKDELGIAFGKGYKRKAIEDPRQTASIRRERNFREASRRAELEDQAHAKHSGILHNEDLAKLKAQPVHVWNARTIPETPHGHGTATVHAFCL